MTLWVCIGDELRRRWSFHPSSAIRHPAFGGEG
jgi:hypothetical protein